MLKKIALVMLLALPMGVFAQNLKFGHINAQEIITVMPEFTKAQNDIQNLEKQLTAELQRTQEEFNKKYQEFQQAIAKDSLPANIAERRQKELQDMMQRQEQFQQDAQQQMASQHHSRRRQLLFSAACICLGIVWVPLSLTSWSTQWGPLIASILPSLILAFASSRCRG